METVNTIVAALDLEADPETVLARAAQLTSLHGARLIVLHVIESEPLAQAATLSGRSESELQDQLKREALATIEPLVLDRGRTRRTEVPVAFGSPYDVITRVARERHADLIVIGPGKAQSLTEKVLGSTADRVIRTASVPVLVARKRQVAPYRHVAVAIDFSTQSAAAIKEARRLAPDALLELVHAADIPLTFEQSMVRAGTPQAEIEQYRLASADLARDRLRAFAHEVIGYDNASLRILDGAAGATLVRLSNGPDVDLLAMGPHGRGVVLEALLGSVTQQVVRQAACDVLVARAHR